MPESDIEIERLFEEGSREALNAYLQLLHPADIAELFDVVDGEHWTKITKKLSPDVLAEVFTHLDEEQRNFLSAKMKTQRLISVVDELETDDAADILAELPDDRSTEVLGALEDRDDIEALLAYDEDTAGGIMQTELCRVRDSATVADAIEAVRTIREEIDDVLEVYTVDSQDRLQGIVALEDLVLSTNDTPLASIAEPIEYKVTPDVDQEEVAAIFRKYDVATLPVVDQTGVLLGRITFDDIHDVVEEEATEDVMTMAGVPSEEELVYSHRYVRIAAFRLPWLLTSLFGTLITAYLSTQFAKVPGDALVMSSFVPVVMAMTGNFGSQSAMIITRGFATGRVDLHSLGRSLIREVVVGLIVGAISGATVGAIVHLWQGSPTLGLAVGSAMSISMVIASSIGVLAPALFKKIGVDPAIAAGPFVTTGCDVLGVFVYLVTAIALLT